MHGDFSWIDLSTFDVSKARSFYTGIFGWDFTADPTGYVNATASGTPTAGIFEMPELFRNIGMPSFWMTYIAVDDIAAAVAKAKTLGGKVELEDSTALGRIALIRDPLGAGFTCFDGNVESSLASRPAHGRWVRSELVVSELAKVDEFYAGLFGWSFESDPNNVDRHIIRSNSGNALGAVQVARNAHKGDKEYWIPFFSIDSMDVALKHIEASGGQTVYAYATSDGSHQLVEDPQGAALMLTEPAVSSAKGTEPKRSPARWRSLVGLVVLFLAIVLEIGWLWGVLFLIWVIPDLKTGTTYFIEPLSRDDNPLLYWTIVLTWIALSVYFLTDLL